MFDLAWSEIALIGVVALIAIGPKDLPVAIKAVTDMLKKARRMAAEFQTHVDDMVRDANLNEVRDQVNELRTMDIKGRILSAVDGDHSIRKAMDDPFVTPPPAHTGTPGVTAPASATVTAGADPMPAALAQDGASQAAPAIPAFIPPADAAMVIPPSLPPAPPAFIPPGAGGHAA